MSVEERDKYTGYLTTGHEWNGISELNTKVPRFLLFCLTATILFSLGYWYLMPSWPGIDDYSRGKLDIDQKHTIEQQLRVAKAEQTLWSEKLQSMPLNDVLTDEELNAIVAQSGPALFSDNCGVCHGQSGEGGPGFPRLNDTSWMWGGTAEDILKTLEVGINAETEGTRVSQMPAFGRTNILDSEKLGFVTTYVRSLSDKNVGSGARADEITSVRKGEEVFNNNCAVCHGTSGLGNTALGAPNLVDNEWLYGADQASIMRSLNEGRSGYMPAWKGRLSDVQLRILALYVSGLNAQADSAEN